MILSDHEETLVREIFAERKRQAELFPSDETGPLDFAIMFLALTEEVGERPHERPPMNTPKLPADAQGGSLDAVVGPLGSGAPQQVDHRLCPKCGSRNTYQRSGVGFEDTRRCCACGHTYEVDFIAL